MKTIKLPPLPPSHSEVMEALTLLRDVMVDDVMPQAGRMSFQDYSKLNRGLVLAEKILGPKKRKPHPNSPRERIKAFNQGIW